MGTGESQQAERGGEPDDDGEQRSRQRPHFHANPEGERAERTAAIEAEREAIDKKLEAENARWEGAARLQAALKRARQ